MNRTMKYALGAVLGTMLAMPASAQQFPDVPDNHWAYDALRNLKDTVLFGYPDGLYRGNRPMSRYEFAVATNAAYTKLMGMISGLSDQIKALQDAMDGGKGADMQELRDQLNALKAQVDSMKGWGDEVANLKKLAAEFEKELASLGVDVDAMKKDLADHEARIKRLESVKPAVNINGTVDFIMIAGHSISGDFGVDPGGRIVGAIDSVANGGGLRPAGLTDTAQVFHEAAFRLSGTNDDGPKWKGTLVFGNVLGDGGFGDLHGFNSGALFSDAGSTDIYFQDLSVMFDTSLIGQNFSAEVGRVSHKVGPYLWQRQNAAWYYDNDFRESGKFVFDGAILGFKFGAANMNVFGGRTADRNSVQGVGIDSLGIDRTLGVELMFPIGDMGDLTLAYLWHDMDDVVVGDPDRVNVLGAQLNAKFGSIGLKGSFAQTNLTANTSDVVDSDNKAWDVRAMYDGGNWGVGAGWRTVEAFFSAAGDWGRIGSVWNPTNVEGWNAKLWFKPSSTMSLGVKGESLEPEDTTLGLAGLDRADSFTVWLDYKLNPAWDLMFSYEDTKFNLVGAGDDPTERWYTVGLGYNMGANSKLRLTYQVSDVNEEGGNPFGGSTIGSGSFKGGMLATQLSIKF